MVFVELNEKEAMENNGGLLAGAVIGAVFGTAAGMVIGGIAAGVVGATGGTYEEVNETWIDCTKKGLLGGFTTGLFTSV